MKKTSISIFIILALFINLMTSCVKEEYIATVTVINKTGVEVTDLTFKGEGGNYSKKIEKISSGVIIPFFAGCHSFASSGFTLANDVSLHNF